MRKVAVLLFVSWLTLCSAKVSVSTKEKINWMSIEEVNLQIKKESKPVLIDLFTNWCYWCKVMDKKTYNNSNVISYINDHFYAVKLNAESKKPVIWNDKSYNYNSENKLNDFTGYITRDQPGFPTTVIFSKSDVVPASVQGFMNPKEIEPILKYFGEGNYKTQTYSEFIKGFKSTW